MYAIIEFKGFQFRAEKDAVLEVPYLGECEVGTQIEIPRVLLIADAENQITVGRPIVEKAKVVAEVLAHKRDEKIIVFKMKRRKGYAKKQGHRQNYTQIKIKDIIN